VTGAAVRHYDGHAHTAAPARLASHGLNHRRGSFDYIDGSSTPTTAPAPIRRGQLQQRGGVGGGGGGGGAGGWGGGRSFLRSVVATSPPSIDPATPTVSSSGGPFEFDGTPHAVTRDGRWT